MESGYVGGDNKLDFLGVRDRSPILPNQTVLETLMDTIHHTVNVSYCLFPG